jgi:tRNA U34 5-carboxymethylaminomethyl modifying GTPase MnmE/TrmE
MDGIWYQFPSVKEVIITVSAAERYVEQSQTQQKTGFLSNLHKNNVAMSQTKQGSWAFTTPTDRKRDPVVAILGHYNHGKTTLLDALGKSNICAAEAHGITQVR